MFILWRWCLKFSLFSISRSWPFFSPWLFLIIPGLISPTISISFCNSRIVTYSPRIWWLILLVPVLVLLLVSLTIIILSLLIAKSYVSCKFRSNIIVLLILRVSFILAIAYIMTAWTTTSTSDFQSVFKIIPVLLVAWVNTILWILFIFCVENVWRARFLLNEVIYVLLDVKV